mmetsp:Transcript_2059/g.5715  ORF Transcript_2059/g.5715 Transcript_2059/m.5715 type:complete len:112 (+) Transcript_2059:802-1137(+)
MMRTVILLVLDHHFPRHNTAHACVLMRSASSLRAMYFSVKGRSYFMASDTPSSARTSLATVRTNHRTPEPTMPVSCDIDEALPSGDGNREPNGESSGGLYSISKTSNPRST